MPNHYAIRPPKCETSLTMMRLRAATAAFPPLLFRRFDSPSRAFSFFIFTPAAVTRRLTFIFSARYAAQFFAAVAFSLPLCGYREDNDKRSRQQVIAIFCLSEPRRLMRWRFFFFFMICLFAMPKG